MVSTSFISRTPEPLHPPAQTNSEECSPLINSYDYIFSLELFKLFFIYFFPEPPQFLHISSEFI